MNLDFRIKSPIKGKGKAAPIRKSKSTGSLAARSAGQPAISDYAQPTQRVVSNPLARKRSLQQIRAEEEAFDKSGWGDTDNEDDARSSPDEPGYQRDEVDPIVLSDEEEEAPAPKKRKSVGSSEKTAGGAEAKGKGKGKAKDVPDRSNTKSPTEKCLIALQKIVQKVSCRSEGQEGNMTTS